MAAETALTPNGRLGSKKVKTGCKTCKIRRVKCDEAKPECGRCTNSGRKCDGYSRTPHLQQQKWVDWQPKDRGQAIAIISPERAIISFVANEQELRSFDFYRDRTASSLAHTLDSTFWTDFILCVSHSEPAVRHALVAIGALNERLRPTKEEPVTLSNPDRHLKLALSSYNKAIKCLRSQMQHSQSNLIALLTCILFICVEFLQDNISEALTLVQQGCAMLRCQEITQREKDGNQKSQSQQMMIDTQVMPMFTRLTVVSALCGRPTSLTIPREAVQDDAISFVDLRGARSSLYNIMEQGHAVIRQANTHKWLQAESPELESLRLRHSEVLEQLSLWHIRFTQLRADLEISKSIRLIQAVSLLSMYFTTTFIWITTCLEKAETAYDAYLSQFKQIIEAAELFINLSEERPQSEILFTFEMGLVPPLYFTATRCRYPEVRRQAVSLIRRAPGKEGMWDRAEMMYIASKVIAMEEGDGFDAKDVLQLPGEAARLHDIQFGREDTRPGQRKSVVKYFSKFEGLDGPWHVTKEYFE